jgi:ribonuclease HII
MNKIIIGADEAGRGPVLGPMVIALIKVNDIQLNEIEMLNIKDSKKCSKAQRERLFNILNRKYDIEFEIIEANKIDKLMSEYSLNEIEEMAFIKLINKALNDDEYAEVYIDAFSNNIGKLTNKLTANISNKNIKIIAEHKADDKYKIVSAASIIAKVIRDNEIKKLKKEYGKIGSGYPSDKITINFLKAYINKYNDLPKIARRSWRTSKRLLSGE